MSDVFDDSLAAAAESFFLLPGAETVTYFPVSGASRRIKAVVTRSEAEPIAAIAGGARPVFEVLVKNDSAEGIASDLLDTGGDKIKMGKRVNNRPQQLRILEILNQDAGLMLLAAG
jgi:hypothetical protein